MGGIGESFWYSLDKGNSEKIQWMSKQITTKSGDTIFALIKHIKKGLERVEAWERMRQSLYQLNNE